MKGKPKQVDSAHQSLLKLGLKAYRLFLKHRTVSEILAVVRLFVE